MLRRSNWKNVDKQEKFLLPKLHVVLMALLSNAMVAKTQKSNGKFSLQPDITRKKTLSKLPASIVLDVLCFLAFHLLIAS